MLVAADVGQGPVVVLLHAFPLTRAMWRPQVESLRDLYRVITPDLPGFGDSALGASSIEGFADAVAGLLDDKEVNEPVSLCGLSMGGYVAMAFARKYSHRLASLILADTKAGPDDAAGKAGRDKLIARVKTGDVAGVVEAMLPKLLGPEADPELADMVRALGSSQRPEGVAAALLALRDRPDALPGLAGVRVPTLVIVGQEDAITPPDEARKIAAAVPGAKLAMIEKAGHLANVEQVGAFNDVLLAFLAGVA